MKRYKEYKKTEILWLQEIPSHWHSQRAKSMYAKMNRPVDKNDDVVTCFRDGVVTLRKNRRTTGFTESVKEIGYQGIKKGDLVIHVMDAFAGAIGVSDSNGKGTPVYTVCMANGNYNNYYYAFVVREMAKSGFIQSLYRGIRERSSDFRYEVFGKQLLPIPPRSEQDQIVSYLDWKVSMINKYINAKKKQIELLKELFSKKVTDLLINNTNSYMKMKHLTEYRLQYGANASGVDYTDKYPRYIRITDINNDGSLKKDNVLSLDVSNYNDYLLKDGDILFARSGATVGKSFIYKNEYGKCCFAGYLIRIIPDKKIIIPEYLYYFTLSSGYLGWLKQVFIQTTIPNISAEKYKELNIPYMSFEEQAKLVSKIQSELVNNETIIKNIERKIKLLQEYRTSLISDVVTGRVDVQSEKVPEFAVFENTSFDDEEIIDENS